MEPTKLDVIADVLVAVNERERQFNLETNRAMKPFDRALLFAVELEKAGLVLRKAAR